MVVTDLVIEVRCYRKPQYRRCIAVKGPVTQMWINLVRYPLHPKTNRGRMYNLDLEKKLTS